jgi:hypothetical protein
MRKTVLAVSIAGWIFFPSLSTAQSYQSEVGVGLGRTNWSTAHSDSFGVRATYNFTPLMTDRGPLEEAGFLSRSASLSGEISQTKTEGSSGEVRDNNYGVSLEYASAESPWVATVGLSRLESDFSGSTLSGGGHGGVSESGSSTTSKVAINAYGLGVGYFIADATRVRIAYTRFTTERINYAFDSALSVDMKHLFSFSGDQSLSLTGAVSRTEGDKYDLYGTTVSIDAAYYFSRELGVGAGYSEISNEGIAPDVTDRTWSVQLSQFFAERYRLGATYARNDFAGSVSRSWALTLDARF